MPMFRFLNFALLLALTAGFAPPTRAPASKVKNWAGLTDQEFRHGAGGDALASSAAMDGSRAMMVPEEAFEGGERASSAIAPYTPEKAYLQPVNDQSFRHGAGGEPLGMTGDFRHGTPSQWSVDDQSFRHGAGGEPLGMNGDFRHGTVSQWSVDENSFRHGAGGKALGMNGDFRHGTPSQWSVDEQSFRHGAGGQALGMSGDFRHGTPEARSTRLLGAAR
eukprot:CAMPEP_0185791200 /NCGR_PEP_ID=MMETSP1174-20130828/158241_1 /TAXON_ID=35687 /ORGANISM="Dictyocha speculum, Strain CCMP1381" /LENGTH=219 /DNA_ID=CAMNT_0028486119 /DNA_START=57 /DNA_END=716 /DNA_ORIENTATION=+